MVKLYIVFLNYGFNGVKYFKKYSNAKRLADLKKENVEIESVTPKEFTEIIFDITFKSSLLILIHYNTDKEEKTIKTLKKEEIDL